MATPEKRKKTANKKTSTRSTTLTLRLKGTEAAELKALGHRVFINTGSGTMKYMIENAGDWLERIGELESENDTLQGRVSLLENEINNYLQGRVDLQGVLDS